MDDPKLDSLLKAAKEQADRFFSRWDQELSPQVIWQRIRARPPRWKKTVMAAGLAACLLVLAVGGFRLGRQQAGPPVWEPSTAGDSLPQPAVMDLEHTLFNLLSREGLVLQGELRIQGGVLVEENPQGIVTKIIPYQMDRRGELVLPADRVLLQVGEELLLIGIDLPHRIEVGEEGYYLKRISETYTGHIFQTRFKVYSAGEDWVKIVPTYAPRRSRIILVKMQD